MYTQTIQSLSEKVYRRGINYSLDNLISVLAKFGNPHKNLPPVIHIAGTNGKGSTLTFIAAALKGLEYTIGAFTSPHIKSYRERISINNLPIPEKDFSKYFELAQANDLENKLTEFEVLALMSFLYFQTKKPDFLIYEVGLGGRLDATNVLTPILSIITKIDLDHADILGSSLSDIAKEKAGIIKPNVPVITTSAQKTEVLDVLNKTAKKEQSPIAIIEPEILPPNCQLSAGYQKQNYALAKKALNHLLNDNIITGTSQQIENGLCSANIWGRFTVFKKNSQTIVIDAAHNPAAIQVLCESLHTKFPTQKPSFLLGILKRKDVGGMLNELLPYAKNIYYCDFDPGNSVSFETIKGIFNSLRVSPWDLGDALPNEELLVITGSILFIGKLGLLN